MADLEHLKSFLAVYRTGSVTHAAAHLHLSQPAVSSHVKALEAAAGRRLFVRLARGVSPTPHGHALARELMPHLDALDTAFERLVSRKQLDGLIYLGGPADLMGVKVLPALVPLYDQGLRVSARLGIAEPLLEQLAGGDLDVVIATRRTRSRQLRFEPLFEEDFLLVGSPGWARDLRREAIETKGADALDGAPLIAFDEELPIIREYFDQVFGTVPWSPATVVGDLRAIRDTLIAGAGISVLPRYVVADALMAGSLVELLRPPHTPVNQIFVATRRGALDARSQAVMSTLLRAAPGWAGV